MKTFILTYRDWDNGSNGGSMFICNAETFEKAQEMAGDEGLMPENFMEAQEYPTDEACVIATVGVNDTN